MTLEISPRRLLLALALVVFLPAFAAIAQADTFQPFTLSATGQILSQAPCAPTLVCQESIVSGKATRFGAFTGHLSEVVDITNGRYTGSGTFATTGGDALSTTYVGRVSQPNSSGSVSFVESHHIVGGTGQFAGAQGQLLVVGTADAAGHLSINGLGLLIR